MKISFGREMPPYFLQKMMILIIAEDVTRSEAIVPSRRVTRSVTAAAAVL